MTKRSLSRIVMIVSIAFFLCACQLFNNIQKKNPEVTPAQTDIVEVQIPTATPTVEATFQPTQVSYSDWRMAGYDWGNTNWNLQEDLLQPPLIAKWTYTPSFTVAFDTVTSGNGVVYAGGMNAEDNNKNIVIALDENTGELLWKYTLIEGEGAMDVDIALYGNMVYFGGQGDDHIYALDSKTGALVWIKDGVEDLYSRPVKIIDDKLIYSKFFSIGALDPMTGEQLWQTNDTDLSQGRIASDGSIVVGGGFCKPLTTFLLADGSVLWKTKGYTGYNVLVQGNVVYVVYTGDTPVELENWKYVYDRIAAYDLHSGQVIFETLLPKAVEYWTPLAFYNGMLYVGDSLDDGSSIYMIDGSTGQLKAVNDHTGRIVHISAANGNIYACALGQENRIIALDPLTLDLRWSTPVNDCDEVIVSDHHLIVNEVFNGITLYQNYE